MNTENNMEANEAKALQGADRRYLEDTNSQ